MPVSLSLDALKEGVLTGNRRLLAKAISLIESTRAEDFECSQHLIEAILPHSGASRRIGITGVPGVGKSTFIEAFGMQAVEQGCRIAVLAIDPSSARSGGSILGDKTRMHRLAQQPNVFIRPSPSAGSPGGVAHHTRETIFLCEAAGFDTILVETVGVGQSETAVAAMVDFFLVLMLANAGDELQGMKRGIMEMADLLVINKADGDMKPLAQKAKAHLRSALHLMMPKYNDWQVPVLICSALEESGIDSVWEICDAFFQRKNVIQQQRIRQSLEWMHTILDHELRTLFSHHPGVRNILPELEKAVLEQRKSPAAAARKALAVFYAALR